MKPLILQVAVKILFPLLIVASLLSFLRGHNFPGGGFIGGLVASCAFILLTFAFGIKETTRMKYIRPELFIVTGLAVAAIAFLLPLFFGFTFFEAMWSEVKIPLIGKAGTPILFDFGIYLVVTGVTCKIIFSIGD